MSVVSITVISPARKAELRALEAAATPGPWELIFNRVAAKSFSTGAAQGTCPDAHSFRVVDPGSRLLARVEADPEQVLTPADAAFIAAARAAVPELLDALDAAEKERDEASDALQGLAADHYFARAEAAEARVEALEAALTGLRDDPLNSGHVREAAADALAAGVARPPESSET